MPQGDDIDSLVELFSACQRVLSQLGTQDDELAGAIRKTCEEIEGRLGELGVVPDARVRST